MLILDGRKLANKILGDLRKKMALIKRPPVLAIITIAPSKATRAYLRAKQKAAEKIGVELRITNYELRDHIIVRAKSKTIEDKIIQDIKRLNRDRNIDAIMVQLPLPKEIDQEKILKTIAAAKDIEKTAVTPLGILRLLDEYKISVKGKRVAIVGAGFLIGIPLAKMMEKRSAKITMVGLICDGSGKQQLKRIYPKPCVACRLSLIAKEADILVSCSGRAKIITADMVRLGAVVIDCGSPEPEVDFDAVSKIASAITPVPGGVGPMTAAMLMEKMISTLDKN